MATSVHQDMTPELCVTNLSPLGFRRPVPSWVSTSGWAHLKSAPPLTHRCEVNTHHCFVPKHIHLQPHFPSYSSAERTHFRDVYLPCLSAPAVQMCLTSFNYHEGLPFNAIFNLIFKECELFFLVKHYESISDIVTL